VTTSEGRGKSNIKLTLPYIAFPYLTFGDGRLLHLPNTKAVSARPNAHPRLNRRLL